MFIKEYCQQYSSHSTLCLKKTLESLEQELKIIERNMIVNASPNLKDMWTEKKNCLNLILDEKVKGELIKKRFLTKRDIDAPTSFFFNLERKTKHGKNMLFLKDKDGHLVSDPERMRRLAVDFYTELYSADSLNEQCRRELLQDLPELSTEKKKNLEAQFTFNELTSAVMDLSSGRVPGIDGLPDEFYKRFWTIIGHDFFEVAQKCISEGCLTRSCQRAILTLLPKKGDLTLLKNWRPVAILCSEYKILSKCLAKRLNDVLHEIIHTDQSYCVRGRSIADNLHLMRDLYDYAFYNNVDVGFLSMDQEKAFDRVDHIFLFETLKAFGYGENLISCIKLLYNEATCLIKIGGGLSVPIKVQRGISPISGQLYSIAFEPLLCKFRRELMGLRIREIDSSQFIKMSAYADDLTVLIRGNQDVNVVKKCLETYEKASSAKVNWGKSVAVWCGHDNNGPILPGELQWGREGFKYLGVFLGSEEYRKQNWEGLVEKTCAQLSRWKWLLLQLSYRGRVLVCNNLIAATLWHRMMILEPPEELITDIQKKLVDFFWSGYHGLKAPVLYLPRTEGGQGLVDIRSRIKAFRLQTAQRLLYGEEVSWREVAHGLLRRAGKMGYDRQLFLMDINKLELTGLSSFYKSMLRAWTPHTSGLSLTRVLS